MPAETLRACLDVLSQSGVTPVCVSRFYRTPAWPDPNDPPFVNAVAQVDSALDPSALMAVLERTETLFGRIRSARNAPRTLDLDLVDYDGLVQDGPLALPHPRTAMRAFVLIPLADVAPQWRHPVTKQTLAALIAALPAAERMAVQPLE